MQERSDNPAATRSIRSYVLRGGRITSAQQRALSELWPRYGVAFGGRVLDLEQLFGRRALCTLEIGFGDGEHLVARAAKQPERDFIGVEVHRPGIGHLLLAAASLGIGNLRVIAHDAAEVLEQQIADGTLDEVQLLFPDPWPKKRHHKRRLVQARFIGLVASKLRPAGRLHIATDWEPYAAEILTALKDCGTLVDADPGRRATVGERVATRFERRGKRLSHRVSEFLFVRTPGN